ncbi:dihydroorotase [Aureliella helgolandensis]|uniref:Dihydroorotase n=1 Tax=Aureliella helgolandensis TaxID=2527968 RepID=A0A518GH08_9BACT|nr:dihydroorotase [Aureliella helgolandensis]QDV27867.1 Dihydroorotase [Aureliella helgolandensis]
MTVHSSDEHWLIEKGLIVDPRQGLERLGRLLISGGKIAALDPMDDALPAGCRRVDASGCIVAPGLVDLASELGEPGCEENETIASGTLAAVAGGFTSLACAANTDPPIDTAAAVEFVRQKAARAGHCRVYPIGCVSKGRAGEELAEIGALVEAGAIALSDTPRPISNTALLRRALEYCQMFDRPIFDRPEVTSLTRGGVMHEGMMQLVLALAPMPAEAEDLATSRDLRLLETTGGRLHLSSISTAGSVELVTRSKKRGTVVSVGVRIANLCFEDELLRSFDSNLKVNPPLRSREHIDACIAALVDGQIDVLTSGHQPKSLEKKMQELDVVPFGMTTLDTALSLVITHLVQPGILGWRRVIECMSSAPAEVLGINAGCLSVGKPADVVVIDPHVKWTVEPAALHSRSRNTPLLGKELQGRARYVWVGGKPMYGMEDPDVS